MPTPDQALNDMRLRIVNARLLHAEGKHEEADALTPSQEELSACLQAFRGRRETAAAASLEKKAKKARIASMNLQDLFKAPKAEPPVEAEKPDADV
jgi:hypothetical protein